MTLLEVDTLSVRYPGVTAVDGLTFAIDRGESLGLVGESGSGKTQTAMAIMGLLPADAEVSGDIRVDGRSLLSLAEAELNRVRALEISMVFQDPMQALNPFVRVGDQIARILLEHRLVTEDEAMPRVVDMLDRVGLPDPERQYRAYPHQLSGGMRQRAMIAAALATDPALLIADEPTTALDVTVQAQILDLLEELRDETALLLITHDLGVVAGHCERMLVLDKGARLEEGPTRSLFVSPGHPHTKTLIDAAPRLGSAQPPSPRTSETILAADRVDVIYPEDRLQAVHSADLVLKAGETLALVGESGSGKSSLVRAILGLVTPAGGDIEFNGAALPPDVRQRKPADRKRMSMVFQDPVGSLNPQMRVKDIVGEPIGSAKHASVSATLTRVGLDDSFRDRFPHQLSGGQAQRVAIARAIITQPEVLVCDEAVAALDGTVRQQIVNLLMSIQQDTGLAIIFIAHDLAIVEGLSHQVMVMYLGRPVEIASARDLFSRPGHPYTRALIDAVPEPDPLSDKYSFVRGETPSPIAPPLGCAFHPRCPHAIARCRVELPKPREVDNRMVACHRYEELRDESGSVTN
ncbi:MAG: ABC transporter ATP-binding protein [Woeseiaceae bacterium]|nr:ABC transporter ATP-binding protein [Woeseiaceae bacterium]